MRDGLFEGSDSQFPKVSKLLPSMKAHDWYLQVRRDLNVPRFCCNPSDAGANLWPELLHVSRLVKESDFCAQWRIFMGFSL